MIRFLTLGGEYTVATTGWTVLHRDRSNQDGAWLLSLWNDKQAFLFRFASAEHRDRVYRLLLDGLEPLDVDA